MCIFIYTVIKKYYVRRYRRRRQGVDKKKNRSKKLKGGFLAPVLATVGTSILNKILDGIFLKMVVRRNRRRQKRVSVYSKKKKKGC